MINTPDQMQLRRRGNKLLFLPLWPAGVVVGGGSGWVVVFVVVVVVGKRDREA